MPSVTAAKSIRHARVQSSGVGAFRPVVQARAHCLPRSMEAERLVAGAAGSEHVKETLLLREGFLRWWSRRQRHAGCLCALRRTGHSQEDRERLSSLACGHDVMKILARVQRATAKI